MRCDAVTFADSVKDHRSHSSFANLNASGDSLLANGPVAGATSSSSGGDDEISLQMEEDGSTNFGPSSSSSSEQVAAAAAEWKGKLGRSKRTLAKVDGSRHEMDDTSEELERLIHEKYEAMEQLKKENFEKDATIRKLRATVNGQELKIAELIKQLEKAGIKESS